MHQDAIYGCEFNLEVQLAHDSGAKRRFEIAPAVRPGFTLETRYVGAKRRQEKPGRKAGDLIRETAASATVKPQPYGRVLSCRRFAPTNLPAASFPGLTAGAISNRRFAPDRGYIPTTIRLHFRVEPTDDKMRNEK